MSSSQPVVRRRHASSSSSNWKREESAEDPYAHLPPAVAWQLEKHALGKKGHDDIRDVIKRTSVEVKETLGASDRPLWFLDVLFLVALMTSILLCPYTKVEESFGIQASHDVAYLGYSQQAFGDYDHVVFPGSVRRSFIPPAALAVASKPVFDAIQHLLDSSTYIHDAFVWLLDLPSPANLTPRTWVQRRTSPMTRGLDDALIRQVAARVVLAIIATVAFTSYRRAVQRSKGFVAACVAGMLLVTQPHVVYYSSRLIPNAYALVASTFAAGCYRRGGRTWALIGGAVMAGVAVSMRCDLVLVGVPYAAWCWLGAPRVPIALGAVVGAVAAAASVAASVAFDTPPWQAEAAAGIDDVPQYVWPEGEVFKFNAIEGKSVQWGKSPWHWYGTSALPKLLGAAAPLAALAVLAALVPVMGPRRMWYRVDIVPLCIAGVAVCLFSVLDHKELRFVLPVVPWVNLSAADTVAAVWSRRGKLRRLICGVVILGLLALQAAFFALHLAASRVNYPGAAAIAQLHAHIDETRRSTTLNAARDASVRIHVGNLAAMSGVTRYSFRRGNGDAAAPHFKYEYSKEEGLLDDELAQKGFTHLLSESESVPGYVKVSAAQAFDGYQLDLKRLPFIHVRTRDAVYVHRLLHE